MVRASVPWDEVEKEYLKNPELVAALEELAPEYEIANQLIQARIDAGLTQKQLAEKIGTRQSAISRMEGGAQNVSIGMLRKVARGLNKDLHVVIG
jgi:DNA-binding XRE family transcriptional regulator